MATGKKKKANKKQTANKANNRRNPYASKSARNSSIRKNNSGNGLREAVAKSRRRKALQSPSMKNSVSGRHNRNNQLKNCKSPYASKNKFGQPFKPIAANARRPLDGKPANEPVYVTKNNPFEQANKCKNANGSKTTESNNNDSNPYASKNKSNGVPKYSQFVTASTDGGSGNNTDDGNSGADRKYLEHNYHHEVRNDGNILHKPKDLVNTLKNKRLDNLRGKLGEEENIVNRPGNKEDFEQAKKDAPNYKGDKNVLQKMSNGMNNFTNNAADSINNRMQKNGNGNLFGGNSLAARLGNSAWKHGGSNLTAKGLNGLNKAVQNTLQTVNKIVNAVRRFITIIAHIISSPITHWVVGGIVVLMMLLAAVFTFGNSQIICQHNDSGGGAGGEGIIAWAVATANDDSHGYSQDNRTGNPNYDCSSFVFYAITQGAGIDLGQKAPFSTRDERQILTAHGFTEISWDGKDVSKLQPGDIVWSASHTEIYVGDGKFAGAHEDLDGKDGDSSGNEINVYKGIPGGMSIILRPPAAAAANMAGGGSSGGKRDFSTPEAKQLYEFLTKKMGFSGPGAAGALAIAMRESSISPTAKNAGGGVAGIFQWSGFSNGKNGHRIVQTGKIKPNDDSTLTMENELELTALELGCNYHGAKKEVGNATDPYQAAKDWSKDFEGVKLSDPQTKINELADWAKQACDQFNCHDDKADKDKLEEKTDAKCPDNISTEVPTGDAAVQCMVDKNGVNDFSSGSTQGFVDTGGEVKGYDVIFCKDERIKVCKDGEYGPIPHPAGYQCVWYAWTRLYQIHGKNLRFDGNGGDIGKYATAHGFINPTVPKPGDGLSYYYMFGSKGKAGHVAVVEEVMPDPSGWKIKVSEGNYNKNGDGIWQGYHTRTITKAEFEKQGKPYWFFRHPSW